MMATTIITPGRRFFGDAGSLRSFRGKPPSLNTPSLKTSSLKSKYSKQMPSLLGLKRGAQGINLPLKTEVKDKEFSTTGLGQVTSEKEPLSLPKRPSADVENDASRRNSPNPLQRPRSKSRTIIRLLSTKFRSRSPPPETPPLPNSPGRVPAAPSNLTSKENREAALRARGLLPPLPNKDLSLLEQEQDRHTPIVALDGDAAEKLSAANLVKQEWEAKNRLAETVARPVDLEVTQRKRMNAFKFGGSPTPSINEQISQPTELDPVVEVDTPLSSPLVTHPNQQLSTPYQLDKAGASGSSSSLRSKHSLLKLDVDTANNSQLPSQPSSAFAESKPEPYLVPLPPSPLPSPGRPRSTTIGSDKTDASATLFFATSVPLPPSPNPSSILGTRSSQERMMPIISLSPPIPFAVPPESLADSTGSGPSHRRSSSFPQLQTVSESGSESIMTPSLDASSPTVTVSTLNTMESLPNLGGKGGPSGLKAKHHDHNIPIIFESLVEDANKGSITDEDLVAEPEAVELRLTSDDEKLSSQPPARPRLLTDPNTLKGPRVDRTKSLNPFKRGQTLGPTPSGNSSPPRRLSMISNMRRSVVGSLSRPKATSTGASNQKTFDASHLPPSPTIPASFSEPARATSPPMTSPTRLRFPAGRHNIPVEPTSPRLAVAPVIHSRGSILLETNNIEDEESRRMTELAFLN